MATKTELLTQLAGQWANTVKNDIRTQLIQFIDTTHLTEEQVAQMLAISMGELDQILRGNGECTVTTLSKLIIATGNTLEIKPVEKSPLNGYKNVNPHAMQPQGAPVPPTMSRPAMGGAPVSPAMGKPVMGGAPVSPTPSAPFGVDSKGRPLPDPHELFGAHIPSPQNMPSKEEMDVMLDEYWASKAQSVTTTWGSIPPVGPQAPMTAPVAETAPKRKLCRDAHGRFIKCPTSGHAVPANNAPLNNRYRQMERETLINLIQDNLWDSEIDLNASTVELADFLYNKEIRLNMRKEQTAQQPAEQPKSTADEVNAFADAMKAFVESNPHLRDTLKSFLG